MAKKRVKTEVMIDKALGKLNCSIDDMYSAAEANEAMEENRTILRDLVHQTLGSSDEFVREYIERTDPLITCLHWIHGGEDAKPCGDCRSCLKEALATVKEEVTVFSGAAQIRKAVKQNRKEMKGKPYGR